MFKLLKSKKGFTLVELMIVVVIMAILVAVAVPIFSAVTSKAKIKTCSANQREIQAQLSNNDMSDVIVLADGDTYTLTTTATGDGANWKKTASGKIGTEDSEDYSTTFPQFFQKAPYCPVEGAVITVKVTANTIANAEESGLKIATGCNATGHENGIS